MVHMIHGKLNGFLKDVMLRFVKPTVIKSSASLKECHYKEKNNQRSDADLILGHEVTDFIRCHEFSESQLEEFYTAVRNYFMSVCSYVIATFPLNDEVLQHAMVADKDKRLEVNFSSVLYFVDRFKFMQDELDDLQVEFAHYQVDDELDMSESTADYFWAQLPQQKDKATGAVKYKHLPRVMLMILTIDHSNAQDERIFSVVRKNATEFRPNLSTEVLSKSLTSKLYWQEAGVPCYKRELNRELLQRCKKATMEYNQSISNKY
ncbi:hypothetical protein BSL78_23160 [Apostichopus japonicus]|uniref:HAT C-terminal dimerisation domain-containing protein n=1 Tax=Stichopus japonicus TaxID=307972 RepID=A0A2G8JW82_STIJA|nr:hypothetical protein BSL78_23160 [Apostichopus japonicus]